MDMAGKGLGFWKTMPIRRRVSVTCGGGVDVLAVEADLAGIFAEAMVSCIRLRIRMNVDLPHPDGR